jgi:hypothetical protein
MFLLIAAEAQTQSLAQNKLFPERQNPNSSHQRPQFIPTGINDSVVRKEDRGRKRATSTSSSFNGGEDSGLSPNVFAKIIAACIDICSLAIKKA